MKPAPAISVVLACYNEEQVLRSSFEEIRDTLEGLGKPFEILFVDDASGDRTREIIRSIVASHPHLDLRTVFHDANKGRGATVADGFRAARGTIAGYLDVDLEVHCRYIPSLVRAIEKGADVATVQRVYAFQLRYLDRYIQSRTYSWLMRRLLEVPLKDTETGFKFFRRDALLPVLEAIEDPGWFWDTEFMTRAFRRGLRIEEIPGAYIRRQDKVSTVSGLRDSFYYVRRLLAFRRALRRESVDSPREPAMAPGCDTDSYWKTRASRFANYYGDRGRMPLAKAVSGFLDARTRLLRSLGGWDASSVLLDLGCGSGVHVKAFAPQCRMIVGVDYSSQMLTLAQAHLRSLQGHNWALQRADAQALPFAANRFDWIICMGLLDYAPSPRRVLEECRRVLKDAGVIVFSIPKRPSAFFFLRTGIGDRIKHALFHLPRVSNVVSRTELERLLGEAGLRGESLDCIWTTMWVAKARKQPAESPFPAA